MRQQEFLHGLHRLKSQHRGCVATIGSFDGVHRGHQAVLRQVKDKAKELQLPSLVMVFEPQPYEYFSKHGAPARLMRLREKVQALFNNDINRVLCLKFNEGLRSLTAQEYIEKVLVSGIGIKHLVVGDDFRFGCDRSGDFEMLLKAGKQYGFSVCDTNTQLERNERISSTRIRKLLSNSELNKAGELLGKPYSVTGRVTYGKQLGRTIGFPTLNIGLGRYRSPVDGVYAVTVRRDSGSNDEHEAERERDDSDESSDQLWQGVANVGVRPTVDGASKPLLEVHLLDRNINLYGAFLEVEFKYKIREEKRFSGIEELTLQIQKDAQSAREYFRANEYSH